VATKTAFGMSMVIGETTGGVEQPVFFDTHTQIWNNRPPGILVTGAPGSGKTYFTLMMTAISAIQGKRTIVLDPKGDFLALRDIQDDVGKINFWNMSNKNKSGILDPFYMSDDPGVTEGLVASVIEMFMGDSFEVADNAIISPVIRDVLESEVPSLQAVVDMLGKQRNERARAISYTMQMISRLPFAHLCFAPGNKRRKPQLGDGTTVITLVGMKLPSNDKPKENEERLASTIFFLITDYIMRLMNDDEKMPPKTLIIDEAWVLFNTPAGAKAIEQVALLGRSKNLALMLVTQNNKHIKNLDIENTITTRFAFRSEQREAESLVNDMGLPSGEGFEDKIVDLENGECMMMDYTKRVATVQIKNHRVSWGEAFENNPLLRSKDRE
jgi:type IV secretory pathway VirB4 component